MHSETEAVKKKAADVANDWHNLIDRYVRIEKDGRTVRTGQVETATDSGDVLWVQAWGAEPRCMYAKAMGYTARQL